MPYITGEEREQATWLPARLDDYVAADAPVRVIDAFVAQLKVMDLGFGRAVPAETGRPGYDPRDLLRLYIWGYMNEVRSSRRLERECQRNVEAMWLLRRLAPDFKTIADFRRDNGPAIVGACRAFILFCREQGLFTARLVALDGSKFRAAASPRRILNRAQIGAEIAKLDAQIAQYLTTLDDEDAAEPDETRAATMAALAALNERREDLDAMAARLVAAGRQTLVEGESDARPMRMARDGKPPCYNVQTAVDADTGLILHEDVTTEANDQRLLHAMAKATKDAIGADALTVVADGGYSNGAAAAACEADGITPCVPVTRSVNREGDGTLFDRSAFTYAPDTDTYRCPAGQVLVRSRRLTLKPMVQYIAKDCSGCVLKPRCTNAARRIVQRHIYDEALTRMNARVQADPGLLRARRCSVEYPFGIIKRMTAGGRFMTRGLQKVKAEFALSVLVYNLLRATNLMGAANLRARLA